MVRSQKAALELGDDPNLVWPWYHKAYFAVNYDNQNPLEKNKWAHVVITVDGNKPGMDPVLGTEVAGTVHSKLYINGELFGEGPVAKYTLPMTVRFISALTAGTICSRIFR